jgi:hypothetical protein
MTPICKRDPSLGIEVCGNRSPPLAVMEFVASESYKSGGRQYRSNVSTASDAATFDHHRALLSLTLKKGLPEPQRGSPRASCPRGMVPGQGQAVPAAQGCQLGFQAGLDVPRTTVSEPEKR